jgi:hypothetical protein
MANREPMMMTPAAMAANTSPRISFFTLLTIDKVYGPPELRILDTLNQPGLI